MEFRSSKVHRSSEKSQVQRPLAGLIQNYYDRTATLLKFNAPGPYPAHVVQCKFTENEKRNLIDHGYTLLAFLSVEVIELGVKDRDLEVQIIVSSCRLTLSYVAPLE